MNLLKYPRTRHIEGSRLQPGDEDLSSVPWDELAELPLVIEEKVDGANSAISFDDAGRLLLQSRGHYLTGGAREKHFAFFKTWATTHQTAIRERIGCRYVVYGEWLYAKHTIYYDELPHYFLEFDVFDRHTGQFLATERRQELLRGLPIASVPVIHTGRHLELTHVTSLVTHSRFKSSAWQEHLRATASEQSLDPDRVVRETDPSSLSEGLYIKHEDAGAVLGRYKYVRASFLTTVLDSGTHWLQRPIVPNELADGIDLFEATR